MSVGNLVLSEQIKKIDAHNINLRKRIDAITGRDELYNRRFGDRTNQFNSLTRQHLQQFNNSTQVAQLQYRQFNDDSQRVQHRGPISIASSSDINAGNRPLPSQFAIPSYTSGNYFDKKKRYRRTAQEIERRFRCWCNKAYGSEGSLNQHKKLKGH